MMLKFCDGNAKNLACCVIDTAQNTLETLVYSSVYVSLCAVSLLVVSCVLQGIPCTPALGIIIFLITFSIYNMNRKTDETEDAVNHSRRFIFTQTYGKYLYSASFAFYILALIIAAMYGMVVLFLTLVPLIIGIAYSIPLLPANYRYRRLKEIPTIKNVTLGLIWSTTLSFLPIFILGGSPTATTYVVSIFLYAFFFINTTLFDMRDVIGDRLAGICTIPVYAGMPLTKLALSTINITLGAIVAWYFVNINAYSEVLLIAVATAFTQTLILAFDRYGSNHGFCDIFADGEFIIIGVFLLMTGSVSQLIAHVF